MRRLDVRFLLGCLAAIGALAAAGCGGGSRVGQRGEHDGGRSDDGQARAGARARHARRLPRGRLPAAVDGHSGCQASRQYEVRRNAAHRESGRGLRRRHDEARRQGARGRGVFRNPVLDRDHGRQLGRPARHRVRLGLDQRRQDGAAVHDPAVLRRAELLLRRQVLPGETRTRSRRQAHRLLRELLARDVPERRPRNPGSRHHAQRQEPQGRHVRDGAARVEGHRQRARSTLFSLPSPSARPRSMPGCLCDGCPRSRSPTTRPASSTRARDSRPRRSSPGSTRSSRDSRRTGRSRRNPRSGSATTT